MRHATMGYKTQILHQMRTWSHDYEIVGRSVPPACLPKSHEADMMRHYAPLHDRALIFAHLNRRTILRRMYVKCDTNPVCLSKFKDNGSMEANFQGKKTAPPID